MVTDGEVQQCTSPVRYLNCNPVPWLLVVVAVMDAEVIMHGL